MNQLPFTGFRMPTETELQESARRWLSPLLPCLYENWPIGLQSLSFRTESVPLAAGDIAALLDTFDNRFDQDALGQVEGRVNAAAAPFADTGYYARLNSRSPKDSFHASGKLSEFRCRTGADVVSLFSGSERILDDLARWRRLSGCRILLREHRDIPPAQEWRCFIRDGEVAGISQYFYREHYPDLVRDREHTEERITRFLKSAVLPILHLDSVVVDVWLADQPMVIEINPYGLSDPCLLSYPELEGDGFPLFRIVAADPSSEAA